MNHNLMKDVSVAIQENKSTMIINGNEVKLPKLAPSLIIGKRQSVKIMYADSLASDLLRKLILCQEKINSENPQKYLQ